MIGPSDKYQKKTFKSYAEIAASAKEPQDSKLAPTSARPKYSKGDTHRYRQIIKIRNPYWVETRKVAKKRGRLIVDAES